MWHMIKMTVVWEVARVVSYSSSSSSSSSSCSVVVVIVVVYLTMFFSNSEYTALNIKVISELWIGKEVKGRGRGLI
jgi:hypothetical protein